MNKYRNAIIVVLLSLVLMFACTDNQGEVSNNKSKSPEKINKIGTFTLLNLSEDEYSSIQKARLNGLKLMYGEKDKEKLDRIAEKPETVYFDSLNDMLMALDAGTIQAAELSSEVAKYVVSRHDDLEILQDYSIFWDKKENDALTDFMLKTMLSYDYSFMATSEKVDLLNEMDKAVADMKKDGSMKKIIDKYIDGALKNDPEVASIDTVDGRETINIIVTGDMPPIDYMTAGGEPTGFNVALLAEIGNRINKNIKLVSANAGARALMLSSGEADIAFWTRSSDGIKYAMEEDIETNDWNNMYKAENEEDKGWVDYINEKILPNFDVMQYGTMDIPEGLEISSPYFTSTNVFVVKK